MDAPRHASLQPRLSLALIVAATVVLLVLVTTSPSFTTALTAVGMGGVLGFAVGALERKAILRAEMEYRTAAETGDIWRARLSTIAGKILCLLVLGMWAGLVWLLVRGEDRFVLTTTAAAAIAERGIVYRIHRFLTRVPSRRGLLLPWRRGQTARD